MASGVFVKDIAVTDGWAMQLVRFEPGARFPLHRHERPEALFILEGELVQAGRRMGPGWASVARTGTIDEDVHSETGCIFVLSTRREISPAALEIRRATPADAARLTAIARAAKAHWSYPAAWLTTWEPALTITPDYVRTAILFVGAHNGEPIGFYALEPRGDRWSLEHMWVEPGKHGRGAGRSLFTHALGTIRALRPGVLVIESDPFAAGFYARMGARQTGAVAAPMDGAPDRRLPVFEIEVR